MSPSRIDELRRRVQNDPASIAFAQLAEEYRRSGQTDEAVRICREGLTRHPGYLSARVTLGRALLDLGQLDDARGEFEFVVAEAPENLAAVRGLAEIAHRDGDITSALNYYQRALALARHDPEIEEIVHQLSRQVGAAATGPGTGLSFEEAHQELLEAAERVPLAPSSGALPMRSAAEGSTAPFDFDRLVAALGSPTAPPQLEAAVEGRAAVAPIELPEPVDLGPNPFAALEAELRAHEPIPVVADARERPWESLPAEPDVLEAAVPALDSITGPAADILDDDSSRSAELLDVAAPFGPEVATGLGVEAAPAAPAEPSWSDVLAAAPLDDAVAPVDTPAVAPSLAVDWADTAPLHVDALTASLTPEPQPAASRDVTGEATAPAPSPEAAAPAEDLLDDLESWLNTLHDRTSE